MDRHLSLRDRILVRIHRWVCPPCNYIQKQFNTIRQACRWTPAEQYNGEDKQEKRPVLPDDVCARIQSKIDELLK
jgi:hypothetical protein